MDFKPEPDLHPLYPAAGQIAPLLSSRSGLSPSQKAELVSHCLTRSCVFGDLQVLSYLLGDPQAQPYIDLSVRDEDGLGLISTTILGFGSESERDVEREECVRLLVTQGTDINGDNGACIFVVTLVLCDTNDSQPGGHLCTMQHYYPHPRLYRIS